MEAKEAGVLASVMLSKRECGSSCTETSAKKLRLERDEYDEKENDDMKYGFANMRNTSCINSVLQCFLSMDCLISVLKRTPHNNGIITPLLNLSACRFDAMTKYKKKFLKQFKLAVQKSSDEFEISGEQEDAHDYCFALMNGIEKELRIAHPKDKTIGKEFEIEIKSSKECKSCLKKNTSILKLSDIDIEVPVEKFHYRIPELEELVERSIRNTSFISSNCECGEKSNEITTKLHKLPNSFKTLSGEIIETIDTPIAVSSVLNMEPYCSEDVILPITDKSPSYDKRFKYHLYGVIEHHGLTAHMGHYVSHVRHEDEWLYCDDESITTVSEDTVLNDCRKTAFLLFYIHNSYTTGVLASVMLSKRECGSSCTETSAKKLRLEKDEYDEKENDDMKYGFANMRNTCYMNSILQCFLSMNCLISALKRKPHDKGIINPLLDLSACRFDAMSEYKKNFLKQFKLAVQKSSDKFQISGEQEDAHEYYLALKEGIEKELCIAHPKDKTIEKVFEIEIKSSRECKSCPKKNTNLQKFSDIGIEVPVEKFPYRIHELEELVERSIRNANVLSPNCKCGVKSNEITTKLHKLPKILVVHLRRYQARSLTRIQTIDTPIAVSSVLNMEPYCSKDVILPITDKSPSYDKRFKYHLYGVIEHHGLTTHMGHYVARVRHEDEWLYCDDEIIRTVSEDTVLNDCRKTAFLLFYIHNSHTI